MKLKPVALAVGAAVAFAIIWSLCSAFVVLAPGSADAIFAAMMHADMPMMRVTLDGFLIGLVGWVLGAAVTALALALCYNALAGGRTKA